MRALGGTVRVGGRGGEEHPALARLQVERDELVVPQYGAEQVPGNHPQRLELGPEHPLDHVGSRDGKAIRIPAAGERIRADGEEDELRALGRGRGLEAVTPARPHQAVGLTPNHVGHERIERGQRPAQAVGHAVSAELSPSRRRRWGRERSGSGTDPSASARSWRSCRPPATGREGPAAPRSRWGAGSGRGSAEGGSRTR